MEITHRDVYNISDNFSYKVRSFFLQRFDTVSCVAGRTTCATVHQGRHSLCIKSDGVNIVGVKWGWVWGRLKYGEWQIVDIIPFSSNTATFESS